MYFFQLNKALQKVVVAGIVAAITVACGSDKNEKSQRVVAEAMGYSLTDEDLSVLTAQTSDSTLVQQTTRAWIENTILGETARRNFKGNKRAIEVKVEAYERQLLYFAFEQEEIARLLDTFVHPDSIKKYYELHLEEFKLNDYLAELLFIRLKLNDPLVNRIAGMYNTTNSTELLKIMELTVGKADTVIFNKGNWMYFDEVIKLLPVNAIYNKNWFVTGKIKQRFQDENFVYYLNLLDYRRGTSPLEFETPNIKESIIQQRILELRRNMRKEILEKAIHE